ncbi:Response regulator receiver domain-containing protein [Gammaproteobacteria bacterium]
MQILVVDDDPLAAAMTSAILEESGHETMVAENAIVALERLAAHGTLKVVVADLNMPLVSGIELFQEMTLQGYNLPFVLLTGDNPEELADRTTEMAACLMKDEYLEERLPNLLLDLGLVS